MNNDEEIETAKALFFIISRVGSQMLYGVLAEAMFEMLTPENQEIFLQSVTGGSHEH